MKPRYGMPVIALALLLTSHASSAQTGSDPGDGTGAGCNCAESTWIVNNFPTIWSFLPACVDDCHIYAYLGEPYESCSANCLEVALGPYVRQQCSQCFYDYWLFYYTNCVAICDNPPSPEACTDCFAVQLEQLKACLGITESNDPTSPNVYMVDNPSCTCSPTASSITKVTGCAYTLNGITYSASGIYSQTILNAAGCDSTITLDLTIDPLVVDGGADATVYYGPYMGAACTTLTGTASGGAGGTQLAWEGGEQGVGTSLSQSVCPTMDMTYTFTATDADGCTATDDVLVTAVDLSCGSGSGKVYLCINGTTVCANLNAVTALLNNHPNASIGPCTANKSLESGAMVFGVFPNPNDGQVLNIAIGDGYPAGGMLGIDLHDLSGHLVRSASMPVAAGGVVAFPLNGEVAAGVYLLQLTLGDERRTERVVVRP